MESFFDLTGKAALVTGGGGFIGGACARALARAGADVAVVDLREEPAQQVAEDVRRLGRNSVVLVGDASDFELTGRQAAQAVEQLGRMDVLVNVAGGGDPRYMHELTREDFDRIVTNNLMSAWNWCKHLAPELAEHGAGRIVNIASISAKHGGGPPATVSKSAYAAAKAGVLGLTRGLAKELAPRVTVNAVCPGLIETPRTQRITGGEHRDRILGEIPLQRFGQPDDVAAAVLFLASPGAGWITAESMDVNGGQYID